ncbi:hypothetical protein T484DRAFT_1866393 [Baffinella frigidus]|nr:hypothetical protein T484DRAFT_1866393 [Cryptophyta sp. CCMP2293]
MGFALSMLVIITMGFALTMLVFPSVFVIQRTVSVFLAVLGVPMWMVFISLQGRISRFLLRVID